MSSFEVKIHRIKVEAHPNADRLEIGRIVGQDYQFIVGKGQFTDGSLFVYIPEAAIVPDWLLEEMGLVGKLNGLAKNRVKAQKFRGVLSQGLAYEPPSVKAGKNGAFVPSPGSEWLTHTPSDIYIPLTDKSYPWIEGE